MMKIKNKRSKKPYILTASAIVVAAGLVAAWYFSYGPGHKAKITTQPDITNPQHKDTVAPVQQNKNVDTSKNTEQIPVSHSVGVKITSLSQKNGYVTYSADISNGKTNGTCSAEYTATDARPVDAPTTTSSNGTCGPVQIPDTEFTKLGTWTLTVRYYENNSQSTDTMSIEVH